MAKARINGVELFYEDGGEGEAILVHHGYTGSHYSWVDIAPRLRERFRVILMDGRGAGDSEHPEGGYTIEQYADDVIGMADHLGLERFTYLGHSMGGVIGMELGLRYAERLERLILVAPAPADGVTNPPEMFERAAQLRAEADRETMIRDRMAMSARPQPREDVAAAVERALSASDGHFAESWWAMVEYHKGDRLGEITTPTLLIAGTADGLLRSNLADFQRLPNATLHVFSRVSHGIQHEAPDDFVRVVEDFMEHGVVTSRTLLAAFEAEVGEG